MKQGELILTDFPFSDLSQIKVRPSLIVSNDSYNSKSNDILVCAVTSNPKEYEYSVAINQKDLESGRLLKPSQIKSDKLMLMNKTQIRKVLGKISKGKFIQTVQKIGKLVSEQKA